MFAAFLGESNVIYLRSQIDQGSVSSNQDQSGQIVLLSAENFEHFRNGRLSFRDSFSTGSDNWIWYPSSVTPSYEQNRLSIWYVQED
jgi:hypothetical protein